MIPSSSALRPAVFFDRDGTLMEEVDYCHRPEDVRAFPLASDALQRIGAAGFLRIIITNQAGIGRGYFSEEDYRAVHRELLRQLGPGRVDATYHCPDPPWEASPRRKPAPGMVLQAARDHGVDLARSWFVGDKTSDIQCGRRAGTKTILVMTGYGHAEKNAGEDFRATDISAACSLILASTATQPNLSDPPTAPSPHPAT